MVGQASSGKQKGLMVSQQGGYTMNKVKVILLLFVLSLGFWPLDALSPVQAQDRGGPPSTGFFSGGGLFPGGGATGGKFPGKGNGKGGGSKSHGSEPVSMLLFGIGLGIMKLRSSKNSDS